MKNGGMPPILSAAASAPVSTQTTPGAAFAALTSTRLITRMRVRRQHRNAVALPRQARCRRHNWPDAGGEALILDAADRLSDAEFAHGGVLASVVKRRKPPSTISARAAGVAAAVGGEKADGLRDLLRPRVTAERDLLVEPFAGVAAEQLAHGLLGGAHERHCRPGRD